MIKTVTMNFIYMAHLKTINEEMKANKRKQSKAI